MVKYIMIMSLLAKSDGERNAVAYVRSSAEHQQYSLDNQLKVIREFACRSELEIVRVFSDEGRSGLRIQGRAALAQLLAEVLGKKADFAHVLIYDVSRWGRFQDPDEAAHYEFLCRQTGVTLHYCAEEFTNDYSLPSVVVKGLKRAMAGEYSRELSDKVYHATRRVARMGYLAGGCSLLGLRRMLVDEHRQPKIILNAGEQKLIQAGRVVLAPGPAHEINVVRSIFDSFVEDRLGPTEIARRLNRQGVLSASGRPWTDVKIGKTLRNERYIGNLVYGRRSSRMGGKSIPNPPALWIRSENAFPAIVPPALFFQAQARFQNHELKYKHTQTELLDKLRALHSSHKRLSQHLINQAPGMPKATAYNKRFGSLIEAYRLIGVQPPRHFRLVHGRLGQIRREMIAAIIRVIQKRGGTAIWRGRHRQLLINNRLRVRIHLLRHNQSSTGQSFWRIHNAVHEVSDLTLAVRMARDNQEIKDFYLLPHLDGNWEELNLTENNGVYRDTFRFDTLDFLANLGAQTRLKEGA